MPTDEKCPKCGGPCEKKTVFESDGMGGEIEYASYRSTAQQRIEELERERDEQRESNKQLVKSIADWERANYQLEADTDPVLQAAIECSDGLIVGSMGILEVSVVLQRVIAASKRCEELKTQTEGESNAKS